MVTKKRFKLSKSERCAICKKRWNLPWNRIIKYLDYCKYYIHRKCESEQIEESVSSDKGTTVDDSCAIQIVLDKNESGIDNTMGAKTNEEVISQQMEIIGTQGVKQSHLVTIDVTLKVRILRLNKFIRDSSASTDSTLWAIERDCLQNIMMATGLIRQIEYIDFLKSVPIFKDLSEENLIQISDVLEETSYNTGDYIIQGALGDMLFIINKGKVKVTITQSNSTEEKYICTLQKGDFFNGKVLQSDYLQTANIIACDPDGVSCLVIDQETFNQFISGLDEIRTRYKDSDILEQICSANKEFKNLKFSDLQILATLGEGGFGRVHLVLVNNDTTKSFALKQIKKSHIVQKSQQDHILSEKRIMEEVNCQFIVKLHKTFKDEKYVYMLMESCLGGDLWTALSYEGYFYEPTTRFYVGCIVEALDYLHTRNIIYRDLKPENIVLDNRGYAKLIDFGFAKKLHNNKKTWSFCGSAEYMAPEVFLKTGTSLSADYWSLGIFMFKLLAGRLPFLGESEMETLDIILEGIDSIEFPEYLTRSATDLIKNLCIDNPDKRLTKVQTHEWFIDFDWESLRNRSMTPPILPEVCSAIDTQNFDLVNSDSDSLPPDENSGWDFDF